MIYDKEVVNSLKGAIMSLRDEIISEVDSLPDSLKAKLLDYAKSLGQSSPMSSNSKDFMDLFGCIETSDVELMKKAIEEDCSKVDLDEW